MNDANTGFVLQAMVSDGEKRESRGTAAPPGECAATNSDVGSRHVGLVLSDSIGMGA